ncbi:MAG: patatin-like phospholipase family protein [Gammaproteobacteria bacterium]|jgi:NTE family protein
MSDKKTVSLVLGSGGARGLVHIGIIDELVRNGLEIKAIAGCSMGALIGGIFAMGQLDVYKRWVTGLERRDVIRLLDLTFARSGLIKGDRIISVLRSLIGDANIEDLPIRFTAVATDVEEEKEVWFNHGSLFDAIRASIAIPTVFTPHRYLGRYFLDGGLINPIPIAPTLEDETDLTVAVNLSGKPRKEAAVKPAPKPTKNDNNYMRNNYQMRIAQFIDELKLRFDRQPEGALGVLDIIIKSMNIMENTLAETQLITYSPDIVIEIPRDVCNFYEFHRAQEMIEVGRQKTRAVLEHYAKHTTQAD